MLSHFSKLDVIHFTQFKYMWLYIVKWILYNSITIHMDFVAIQIRAIGKVPVFFVFFLKINLSPFNVELK